MTAIPRLDENVNIGAFDWNIEYQPVMLDFDNIAAVLANDRGHSAEQSRPIVQADDQMHQSPVVK